MYGQLSNCLAVAYLFNSSWQHCSIKGGHINKAGSSNSSWSYSCKKGTCRKWGGHSFLALFSFRSWRNAAFPTHTDGPPNAACARNPQFLAHTVTRGPLPSALAFSTVLRELKWPQTCNLPGLICLLFWLPGTGHYYSFILD